jgi:hypothetical protein
MVLGPAGLFGLALVCLRVVHLDLLRRSFGWKGVTWTGWLGTAVHELSHAAAALAFGHKVRSIRLFDPSAPDGVLGYVKSSHNPRNPVHAVGSFFVGVAPLIGGCGVLFVAAVVLLPGFRLAELIEAPRPGVGAEGLLAWSEVALDRSWSHLEPLLRPSSLESWRTWAFVAVAACLGAHLAPSVPDLKLAWRGFAWILGLAVLVNLVALLFGGLEDPAALWLTRLSWPFVATAALSILVCCGLLAVYLVLFAATSALRRLGMRTGEQLPWSWSLGAAWIGCVVVWVLAILAGLS